MNDRLFETLDPTTRAFEQDGRRYLVTDTVGFIRRLPHQLVEGFAATLEETLLADLILHVADASEAEERLAETIAAVETVLKEIDADHDPARARPEQDRRGRPAAAGGGSRTATRARCRSRPRAGRGSTSSERGSPSGSPDRFEPVRLLVPYADGRVLAELYEPRRADRGARGPRRTACTSLARLPRSEARALRAVPRGRARTPAEQRA